MRRMQHRIAIAIGLLMVAGATTAHAQAVRQDGRGFTEAQRGSFLPGFRVPPELQRRLESRRHANAPQVQHQPRVQHPPRQAQAPSRSSRQAMRAHQTSTAYHVNVAEPVSTPSLTSRFSSSALVSEARRYLGTNPTKMARRWCARFMNLVLKRVGLPGTGSDAAKSFAHYGRRISGPQYGAIAVLTRKGGGHVGIVTGVDRNGNPILIAGNNGRRKVGISVYPKRRVIAYVMPDGRAPSSNRYASSRASRAR